jgi:hypothetical protein
METLTYTMILTKKDHRFYSENKSQHPYAMK